MVKAADALRVFIQKMLASPDAKKIGHLSCRGFSVIRVALASILYVHAALTDDEATVDFRAFSLAGGFEILLALKLMDEALMKRPNPVLKLPPKPKNKNNQKELEAYDKAVISQSSFLNNASVQLRREQGVIMACAKVTGSALESVPWQELMRVHLRHKRILRQNGITPGECQLAQRHRRFGHKSWPGVEHKSQP